MEEPVADSWWLPSLLAVTTLLPQIAGRAPCLGTAAGDALLRALPEG